SRRRRRRDPPSAPCMRGAARRCQPRPRASPISARHQHLVTVSPMDRREAKDLARIGLKPRTRHAELHRGRRRETGRAVPAAGAGVVGPGALAQRIPVTAGPRVAPPTTADLPGPPEPAGFDAPLATEPAPPGFPVPAAPAKHAPLPPPLDWLTAANTHGASV